MDKRVSYGLITGSAAGIWLVVYYEYIYRIAPFLGLIGWIILGVGVYLGTRTARESIYQGKISFSQAVMAGVIISFFAGLVTGIFNFIYVKWINTNFLEFLISESKNLMAGKASPEEIQKQIEEIKKSFSPSQQFFASVTGTLFYGLIISLVIAIILRNKAPQDFSQSGQKKSDNNSTTDVDYEEVK